MFRTQWPHQVIHTKALQEVEREVKLAAKSPGACVAIIGPCGTGKTVAAFFALRQLGPGYKTVIIQQPEKEKLRISTIMAAVIRELGEEPRRDMEARTTQFRHVLGTATQTHKVVLVIDEAHALATQTLRALKRILELGFGSRMGGLLSIVLVAQPEMWARLRVVREINLRTRKVQMRPLTDREAGQMVKLVADHEGIKVTDDAADELARKFVYPLDIASIVTELSVWMNEMNEKELDLGKVMVFTGDELKGTMERYGITAGRLAKEAGLSSAVVSQTLAGKYPGRDKTRELQEALHRLVRTAEKSHVA